MAGKVRTLSNQQILEKMTPRSAERYLFFFNYIYELTLSQDLFTSKYIDIDHIMKTVEGCNVNRAFPSYMRKKGYIDVNNKWITDRPTMHHVEEVYLLSNMSHSGTVSAETHENSIAYITGGLGSRGKAGLPNESKLKMIYNTVTVNETREMTFDRFKDAIRDYEAVK